MNWYGFELNNGETIEIEAENIRDAIFEVEQATGRRVHRGRGLDGFDNNAAPGRPLYLQLRERPLDIWRNDG
jgi:hypothetical protein